ncbi:MAG: CoA-acylating methylmalonate-semialdehyde dehydrogenase [Planctomycetes bacterium]|nr:CoA-acylating methylmalonate-semialdehyde dehydrogenase [Planctomycetota bacterium]
MSDVQELPNYVDGQWKRSSSSQHLPVINPATAEVIARAQATPAAEVDAAARAAADAFEEWRRIPATDRVQFLFRLKPLLEAHSDEIARVITEECGKTLAESASEVRRGIENVEVACGIPTLLQGWNNENIAGGIDEHLFRQPVGVVAAVTPFNFPAMIPLWFLPYAIACGNSFILKPSQRVPMTSTRLFELIDQTGLPRGVAQLLHGGRETVEAILDHPAVRAISFVGSTPVARQVYARAASQGKRAQCQGGAKNPLIVLPDADLEMATRIAADSAFGCAGQRCLAASLAITVGDARQRFTRAMAEVASARRVGCGLDPGVEMGPVISAESRTRIEAWIGRGIHAGAKAIVDGRGRRVEGYGAGFFAFPTLLDEVNPDGDLARTEIFGPVLSLVHARDLSEAIALVNRSAHGNMACLFTSSGAAARQFRNEALAGNIGINVGVAAPMAFYPFSGWKESFFGDLHAQGRHAVEFYTQTKVVVERWPREVSPTF